MTLHTAQPPGSRPAIDIPAGHRCFTGHWVADGLMLTNLPFEAGHVEALAHEGVELVLNMCEDSEYWDGQRSEVAATYEETGVEENRDLLLVDLGEHPLELFDAAVDVIAAANAQGRNVAVHCRGGRERSATIAAAAMVAGDGISVDEAIDRVRSVAPQAWPLRHQRAALELWEAGR